MLLRKAVSLTPCLALFLVACNDNNHPQAQPQAGPSQATVQPEQPAPQPAANPAESAKPAASNASGSHATLHHHVAYVHHVIKHHVHPAVAPTETAAEPADATPPAPVATVPSGTVLSVRLTQELASKTNNAGDAFTATVAEAVMVDGKALIPEGATVSGKVVQAEPMGALHSGKLQLTLNSVNLNGQDQTIQTSTVSDLDKDKTPSAGDMASSAAATASPAAGLAEAATSHAGNTGALAGAAASTGAVPGSGSAGALTGATSTATGTGSGITGAVPGGGMKTEAEAKVGTAVAALTGSHDLVFPAQAAMKFTLEQPLDVKP